MDKPNRFFIRFKRKVAPYLPLLPKVLAVALGLVVLVVFIRALPSIKNFAPSRTALSLIQSPRAILQSTGGYTNLLLLGKGGAGHEAPDLTDTVIFISIHHPTGRTVMLSLPRDIWVQSLRTKLNSTYYYGNLKQKGGGLILAKAAVEEIIDQPVHYAVAIDFDGFRKAVDLLGGVDIDVKQSFDDYKYPIPGKETAEPEESRYEELHFEAGPQTLNGDRALKYVRSRNAEGEEGTDYARVARQQQIVLSLQKKALSTQLLLSPSTMSRLIQIATSSVDTDITNGDITGFVKLAASFDRDQLITETLDQGDEESGRVGLLINPPIRNYAGQWVLIGKDDSWKQVQEYISGLLNIVN